MITTPKADISIFITDGSKGYSDTGVLEITIKSINDYEASKSLLNGA